MDDTLLKYYEQELTFVREMGGHFARKYPKIAGRLQLEPDKCEDPHIERLIEAFAFISGRIHKKIDDDFPEITESIFNITYPHYNNPIPSMTIVQFDPITKSITEKGYTIDKGVPMFSKPVKGSPCTFTLCSAVSLWPVKVTGVDVQEAGPSALNTVQTLDIQLDTVNDIDVGDIAFDRLRFFLNGQAQHVFHLYERLFNNVTAVQLMFTPEGGTEQTLTLNKTSIRPVGFSRDEKLLPFSKRSFPGYLLLFEYFTFPEKFLFFDLVGLDRLNGIEAGTQLTLRICFDRAIRRNVIVDPETFQLNTAPAVNLFKKIAEPIRIEQRKTEYQVTPDLRRYDATEIYTIDQVTAASTTDSKAKEFRPFYSIRHHLSDELDNEPKVFWHVQRRPSGRKSDKGTDVFLSFCDLNMTPADPGCDILTVRHTCTNRDMPSRLPFGDVRGDFTMELAAPVNKIVSLIKPTPTFRPALGGALQWRLISHLSLNYISLAEGGEDALKEILKLYDFQNSSATRQQISGIVSVATRHITKRINDSFARGVEITITLDEDKFVGSGLYLFGAILDRFLGQYVSVNSFSRLVIKTLQAKKELKKWPPRSGNQILV